MIQTWAILVDAYRELNARKMFWISLVISAIVIAIIGVFGAKDGTLRILWIDTGVTLPWTRTPSLFYKWLFNALGVGFWLSWGSIILALVSSASLIPDFVQGGAVECVLSRPISRTRLFLTKYVSGLLFVALQATAFVLVALLVIGLRGGVWLWGIAVAIPMVVIFFSYLFAVSALVGVWTRSTLASLIAALFVWLFCFGANVAEDLTLHNSIEQANKIPLIEKDSEATRKQLENPVPMAERALLEKKLTENDEKIKGAARAASYHRIFFTLKTILPKTSETAKLSDRAVTSLSELEAITGLDNDNSNVSQFFSRKTMRQALAIQRGRSVWWVVGTSLAFEAVLVGGACWIFSRRDF